MNIVRSLIVSLGFNADTSAINQAERRIHQIPNNVQPAFDRLRVMFAGVFAGIGAVSGIRNIIEAGDQMTKVMNRVRESATVPNEAFEALYNSARSTGVAMDETSKAFMRFAPALRRSGFADNDTIALIDGLQKGLLAAGSTAAETGSVLVQLGQAINSNNFAGDELKSFMENASPRLIEEFARALGVGVDQIKKMGSEGKLTNAVVLPALIAASRSARDSFGRMVVTVELATARSRVAWVRFAAELQEAIGLNARIVRGFEDIGRALEWLRGKLPVMREFLHTAFDLDRAVMALGASLALAFAPSILARIGMLAGYVLRVVLPFAALYLVVEDFISYLQGNESVIGDLIKSLNPEFIEGFKQGWVDIKAALVATWEVIKGITETLSNSFQNVLKTVFGDNVSAIDAFNNSLKNTEGYVMAIVSALALVRVGMVALGWLGAGGAAAAAGGAAVPAAGVAAAPRAGAGGGLGVGAIAEAMRQVDSDPALRDRMQFPAQRRLQQRREDGTGDNRSWREWLGGMGWSFRDDMMQPNGNGMPTVGSLAPAAPVINNSPVINQDITVTAPGSDGASLGSTVGNAARGAAEDAMRLGDSLARDLLRAAPMTEAGAR